MFKLTLLHPCRMYTLALLILIKCIERQISLRDVLWEISSPLRLTAHRCLSQKTGHIRPMLVYADPASNQYWFNVCSGVKTRCQWSNFICDEQLIEGTNKRRIIDYSQWRRNKEELMKPRTRNKTTNSEQCKFMKQYNLQRLFLHKFTSREKEIMYRN